MIGKITSTINFGQLYRPASQKRKYLNCANSAAGDTFTISKKAKPEISAYEDKATEIKDDMRKTAKKANKLKKRCESLYENRKNNNNILALTLKDGRKQIVFEDKEDVVTCTFHKDKKFGKREAAEIEVKNGAKNKKYLFLGKKYKANKNDGTYFLTVYEVLENGVSNRYLFEDGTLLVQEDREKPNLPVLRMALLKGKPTKDGREIEYQDWYNFDEHGRFYYHAQNTRSLLP